MMHNRRQLFNLPIAQLSDAVDEVCECSAVRQRQTQREGEGEGEGVKS